MFLLKYPIFLKNKAFFPFLYLFLFKNAHDYKKCPVLLPFSTFPALFPALPYLDSLQIEANMC